VTTYTIAIIGTGAQGRGLAVRFAAAGHRVVLGSRDADRATAAATKLTSLTATHRDAVIGGRSNEVAAATADIILVATRGTPTRPPFHGWNRTPETRSRSRA
jgi:predicted dinucleotide-binding enzyme